MVLSEYNFLFGFARYALKGIFYSVKGHPLSVHTYLGFISHQYSCIMPSIVDELEFSL
jgi:hypothetical protein